MDSSHPLRLNEASPHLRSLCRPPKLEEFLASVLTLPSQSLLSVPLLSISLSSSLTELGALRSQEHDLLDFVFLAPSTITEHRHSLNI